MSESSWQDRLVVYRINRMTFYRKVYIIASIFVLIALVQWMCLLLIPTIADVFREYNNLTIVFLFIALLVLTLFVFSQGLRFVFPVNLILSAVIVECVVLGLFWAVARCSTWWHIPICILVVMVVVFACIHLGLALRRDLTIDVLIVFAFCIIFFIGSFFCIMYSILTGASVAIIFYTVFIVLTVMLFILYHAQTIHGGRYAEMRVTDYFLAALIIFFDFIILTAVALFYCSTFFGSSDVDVEDASLSHRHNW